MSNQDNYQAPPSFASQQGSSGLGDVTTQLTGIVRNLSANGQALVTALQGRSLASFTVATLPSGPAIGDMAVVTDGAGALAWGANIAGGGSSRYLVWWNGSGNWTVVGK